MKAMVYHQYGSPEVLTLQEIKKPTIKDGEILVRVRAASVNWLDWYFLMGSPVMVRLMAGLFQPKDNVLGVDVAGQVEAVGAGVKDFQPCDEVFGSTDCGCFAEYVCVSETEVVSKPADLTFEAAAAVGAAGSTALHGLRLGQAGPSQQVLINGASGGVGTFAVQVARSLGADVTGVCSTRNLSQVGSLGTGRVIDYTQEDFTRNGERYDLIFDVAAKRSFADCKRALRSRGIYVTTAFSPLLALRGQLMSVTGSRKMVPLSPKPPSKADLVYLRGLLESGAITPVIDRCYPLEDLPNALRYLGNGHARGKVVIKM